MSTAKASLSIALAIPPIQVYHAGSTISGNLNLNTPNSEAIESIVISFSGRCKVKIRKHDHYTTRTYRSRGYYFLENQTLYSGHGRTHRPGTYSWPFTFKIPLNATLHPEASIAPFQPKHELDKIGILQRNETNGPENDFFSPNPPWRGSNDLRPHALPGTFMHTYSRMQTESDAKIEYVLLAKLIRPPSSILFPTKDLEVSQDILLQTITSSSPVSTKIQHEHTIHFPSSRLLASPSLDNQPKLSLKEKTLSLLSLTSTPQIPVQVLISAPKHVVSGTLLPINLQLHPDRNQTYTYETDPPPTVLLQTSTVSLYTLTSLRDNSSTATTQSVHATSKTVLCSAKNLNLALLTLRPNDFEAGPSVELSSIGTQTHGHGFALDPKLFAPGFSTYNIARAYRVGVELRLECTGKGVDLSAEFGLEIVPMGREGGGENASVRGKEEEGEKPPAFEETEEKSGVGSGKEREALREDEGKKEADGEQLPAYEP